MDETIFYRINVLTNCETKFLDSKSETMPQPGEPRDQHLIDFLYQTQIDSSVLDFLKKLFVFFFVFGLECTLWAHVFVFIFIKFFWIIISAFRHSSLHLLPSLFLIIDGIPLMLVYFPYYIFFFLKSIGSTAIVWKYFFSLHLKWTILLKMNS